MVLAESTVVFSSLASSRVAVDLTKDDLIAFDHKLGAKLDGLMGQFMTGITDDAMRIAIEACIKFVEFKPEATALDLIVLLQELKDKWCKS